MNMPTGPVASTLVLATVLEHVTAAVTTLRPDVACNVRLIDRVAGGYRLAGFGGVPIPERTPVIPLGHGLTHAVAERARPILLENYATDSRSLQRRGAASRQLTTFYGTPIGIEGEVLGVLNVYLPTGVPPTLEERKLIATLAGQAGIAIRNAGLLAQSEGRRRAAEALAEVSRGLAQVLDLELLGQRIVDGALDLLQGRCATLLRADPDLGELMIAAVAETPRAEQTRAPRFPEVYEVATWAIQARRVVTIPDFLAVPLVAQNQVIGAVVVSHQTGRALDAAELGLLQAFADYAALALDNARLYSEATRRRHQAEEMARVARLMTESLDFPMVADRIAEAVLALLRVPASVLRLREADGSLLAVGSAGRTRRPFEPGHRLSPGVGIVGQVAQEGRPLIGDPLAPSQEVSERPPGGAGSAGGRISGSADGLLLTDRTPLLRPLLRSTSHRPLLTPGPLHTKLSAGLWALN